jgi:hypothetical protein
LPILTRVFHLSTKLIRCVELNTKHTNNGLDRQIPFG